MKKLLRNILILIVCLAAGAAFVACGGGNDALTGARDAAKAEIQTTYESYKSADYSGTNWTALTAAKDTAVEAIAAAADQTGIDSAVTAGKAAMAAVKTLLLELTETKTAAKTAIESAFSAYKSADYSRVNYTALGMIQETGVSAVQSAESVAVVAEAKNTAIEGMLAVKKISDGAVATAAQLTSAMADQDYIVLTADIELTVQIDFDRAAKTSVLDLNGHRLFGAIPANNNRMIRVIDGTLRVIDGKIDALSPNNNDGAYGAFRVEGENAKLYLEKLEMTNAHKNGLNVKLVAGYAELRDVTMNSSLGGAIEVSGDGLDNQGNAGVFAVADLYDCNFTQTGYYDWCSTTISVSGGGVLNVHSGEYSSENYGAYIFSSGGTFNIFGGNFVSTSTTRQVICANLDKETYPQGVPALNIQGGTFQGGVLITGDTDFATGTAEGLRLLALGVNSGAPSIHAVLTADIDLTDSEIPAITVAKNKSFELDGQGHTLTGITQEALINAASAGIVKIENVNFVN